MKYQYEFIKHYENLPFSIFFHENEEYPLNWHKEIEILFILKGSATIDLKDKNYFLKDKDIILINSNEIHGISNTEENTSILIMQIDPDFSKNIIHNLPKFILNVNLFMLVRKINNMNILEIS